MHKKHIYFSNIFYPSYLQQGDAVRTHFYVWQMWIFQIVFEAPSWSCTCVLQSEEDYNHHHHPQTPTQTNKLENVRTTSLQKTVQRNPNQNLHYCVVLFKICICI